MVRGKAPAKQTQQVLRKLRSLGVDAQLVERSRREEYIGGRRIWGKNSLDLVEIHGEPIRWVNVIYNMQMEGMTSYNTSFKRVYSIVCLVPDPTISKKKRLKLTRITRGKKLIDYIREFSLLSPSHALEVNTSWKGNIEVNLIRQLEQDESLNKELLDLGAEIEIESYPKYGCWAIITRTLTPSRKEWDCFKTVARHLLETNRK